jgi:hypothetical protein
MSSTVAALPVPVAPPEVLAFAAEKGVTPYLPAVLALARRVFPTAPLTVQVEDDPEIEDYRHIVIDVDVNGMEPPQLLKAHNQFSEGLFQVCPSTYAIHFILGV